MLLIIYYMMSMATFFFFFSEKCPVSKALLNAWKPRAGWWNCLRVCLCGAVEDENQISSSATLLSDVGRWGTWIIAGRGKLRVKMRRKSWSHGDLAAPNELRKETDFLAPCRLDFRDIFRLHKRALKVENCPSK